ncbi:MAG: restriction endonuclease subunit S [Pseudomonadota bacterium]
MKVWPSVRLKECTRIVSGATPMTTNSAFWNGVIAWVTPKDLSNLDSVYISQTTRKITEAGLSSCAAEMLPAGSVLFSSRAPIGHVAINAIPMATNQGFKSFVPNPDKLFAGYLYWWLKVNRHYLESLGNGATFKEVSKLVIGRVEIPLPPLDEQRRIAAILDQADALRRKRQDALRQLKTLKQAILCQLLNEVRTTKRVKLNEICKRVTDGTHQSPEWAESGVPFIFVSNIRDGEISLKTNKYVSLETYHALTKSAPIEKGDVLYTTVGSYGHSAVINTDKIFIFQRHVAHIKPKHHEVFSEFLSSVLESPKLRQQADRVAKGIAQKTVILADLKSFEVDLPAMADQEKFSEHTKKMDQLREHQQMQLERLDGLFASLQHRAFRGEL